jgi:hypothetical protein
MQLMGVAARPGIRDASHAVQEDTMVTPAGGSRPTPMTLQEAQALIAKQRDRLAKARAKRKARMAEARAIVAADAAKRK